MSNKRQYDPNKTSPYDDAIAEAAALNGVSYNLLRKQLWLESGFNPQAQSPTGPKGIAQFTKATGEAYGLSDSDRLDPVKSIHAAAKHVADLTKKFDGDELKAVLAYNVGEGPKGKPQLEAYDRGDFSAVGDEGRNYMRTLMDTTKSSKRGDFAAFVGTTPKAKGVSFESAMGGIGAQPKVGTELPESISMDLKGKAQQAPNVNFAKERYDAYGETVSEAEGIRKLHGAKDKGKQKFWEVGSSAWKVANAFKGTGDAIKGNAANSMVGLAVRAAQEDNSMSLMGDMFTPTRLNSHTWSKEELERIRKEVKNPAYIKVVAGGSPDNLDALIEMANRNYEYDAKTAKAHVGAQIIGGVAGAAFDPLTYVPVVGQAGKAVGIINKGRKAMSAGVQAGALNVASESVRTSFAGGEAHYAEAALGGLVFGAGMSAAAQAFSHNKAKTISPEGVQPEVLTKGDSPKVSPEVTPEVDPMVSMAHRYEVRMDAMQKGMDYDPASISPREGEALKMSSHGVPYMDAPEGLAKNGDVRMADGSIISGSNPLNPKTLDTLEKLAETERAAKGFSLGSATGGVMKGYDEVSMVIMRSESPAIRGIGADLIRPTTGLESGAGGKFGSTASDVFERLRSDDYQFQATMSDTLDKALKDVRHDLAAEGYSKAEQKQFISRRVAEAVEDMSGNKMAKLTEHEKALVDLIRKHHDYKAQALKNPAMFGNDVDVSKAAMTGSHFEGGYYPVRYDAGARTIALNRVGGDVQELKEAIKASMLGSYRTSEVIKARVDNYIKTTGETVSEYAERKAYGIASANGEAKGAYTSSGAMDDVEANLASNSYLEERHLFGSDFEVTLKDGDKFSINDLRHFDMEDVLPAYNRRVNGDISILAGTGKTTKELVDDIDKTIAAHSDDPKAKFEAESLREVVKIITGRARRDPEGALATMARSLNDLAYTTKNSYMGIQNYTEIGAMVARAGVDNLARSIPTIGKYMSKKNKLNAREASEVHSMLFGKELDDHIIPKRADVIERLRMGGASDGAAKAVGSLKWATGKIAARWPLSRVMVGTTNHIVKSARIETLGNIAAHVHVGKKSFVSEGMRKSAGITDAQWSDIKAFMKEHTVHDPKSGEFTFVNKEAMRTDPRAMSLWRLADHVASETILRPDKVSFQAARQTGAALSMAMQFKNFVVRSVNGRFVRSWYESTKNGRALDQSMMIASGLMLSGAFQVLRAHIQALGMQDAEAGRYLNDALKPEVLAVGAITRSSILGAPIGVYGFLAQPLGLPGGDLVASVRTSMNPRDPFEKKEKTIKGGKAGDDYFSGLIDRSLQQIPALQWSKDLAASIQNYSMVSSSKSNYDSMMANDATYRSLSRVVPNDPVSLWLLKTYFEYDGIMLDRYRYTKYQ